MSLQLSGTSGASAIQDGIVGTAKLAPGSATPEKLSQPMTQTVARALSGKTLDDITGIPAWAKKITVAIRGVSTNGASPVIIQIGGASGIVNSGYSSVAIVAAAGSATVQARTDSFTLALQSGDAAAASRSGGMVIFKVGDSNSWSFIGGNNNGSTYACSSSGGVDLAEVLDRIRITTANGTDAFDAGSWAITYEG